jgi:hypothetical protein
MTAAAAFYRTAVASAVTHLELQPWESYSAAFGDLLTAFLGFVEALYVVTCLTTRPIGNALKLLLKAVAPHVKAYAIAAYQYQVALPRHVHCLQAAFLAFLAMCYALRAYIVKKKYVPRFTAFVAEKKMKVAAKYKAMLASVARINSTFALLLPHLLYVLAAVLVTRLCRPAVVALAEGWGGIWLLSVGYPVVGTVAVVQGLASAARSDQEAAAAATAPPPETPTAGSKKKKKPAEPTPVASPNPRMLTSPLAFSPTLRVGGGTRRTVSSAGKRPDSPVEPATGGDLEEDLSHVVMYWVVFATLTSLYTFLTLVPFVGRHAEAWNGTLVPMRLFGFLWLHLPGMDGTRFLYTVVCPVALRFADSSIGDGGQAKDSWTVLIEKMCSFLSLASMMGLCQPSFKDHAVVILRESFSLLPPLICLGMPGYFVNFGIIYASLLVPAVNAAKSNREGGEAAATTTTTTSARVRWSKYFCVYAVVSFAFKWFEKWLWYVPFSTHLILILYMYLALPGFRGVDRIYAMLVRETAGVGIVEANAAEGELGGAGASFLNRGLRALTSGEKKKDDGAGKGEEEKKQGGGGDKKND